MTDPTPIRHEYGTPRYLLNDLVETSDRDLLFRDADTTMPQVPDRPGYYILNSTKQWVPTDGLSYRTFPNCIRVLPMTRL